ncbi:MAG TPA: PQQ-binding-like beta-propeller repeat protein [Pirellulaceae bacterium]|nr:PQQ-binding-like beta-propeller repeat protein [Pirellulaceae bacterium]
MSAKKLIELLERNAMLEDSVIKEVRKLVADSKSKVTAESVAKALVDKGHLTKFQATKLVNEVTAQKEATKEARAKAKGKKEDEEEELGFVSDEELDGTDAPAADDADDVVMLEDAGGGEVTGLTPVEDAAGGLTPVGTPPAALTPLPDQSLTPLGDAGGLTPLEDLHGGAASLDPFATEQPAPGKPAPGDPQLPGRKVRGHRNRWDSKLMLGGAFFLILLIISSVVLYINLTKTPAVDMWEAAMEDYRSASYPQAMKRFENFLKKYPDDDNASEARVRINFCLIRAVINSPDKGLERAKDLLPPITEEPSFSIARPELARMLIQIPQGFIKKAKATGSVVEKEKLADLADVGLKDLVNNSTYVPSSTKQSIKKDLDEATEDIARIRRDVNRDKDLRKAIDEIDSKLESNDTVAAFEIFKALIKKYPSLEPDADLMDAVKRITTLEGGLVKVTDEPVSALSAENDGTPGHTRIVLTTREGKGSTRVQNRVATLLAGGSVLGLDAGTGKVLWDRFVGYGTRFHPVRLSKQPDADVLVVDDQELVRLKATTGQVVYRLPAGAAISRPAIAGNKIYVPTISGRIYEVDAATGESARHVSIPQQLSTGLGVANNLPFIFQPGDHSNLYALTTDDLTCKDVYYFGHRGGTIAVPPVVLMGHVFVAENKGRDFSLLHVLKIDSEGERLLQTAQEPIRLKGNVVVPLQVYGSRLLAVTDRSDVRVFNINVNAEENPVAAAAVKSAASDETMISYPLTDSGTLWLADNRLAKFDIQVTSKDIILRQNMNRGDAFVAPLQMHGDVLVLARRKSASAGVTISAVNIDQPRRPLWETNVGIPVGRVAVDVEKSQIRVITAAAALFNIDKDSVATGLNDQPTMTARSTTAIPLAFTEQIELPNGRIAFFNPGDHNQLLIYDPAKASRQLNIQPLDLAGAAVTCTPIALQDGLLVPLDQGAVRLIDPATGQDKVLPFQPRLEPGEKLKWLRPTVVGSDGREFIIANDRREIYRIGIKDTPKPFLAELASGQLDVDFASQLAAVGDVAFAVVQTSGGDVLKPISTGDLTVGDDIDLQGARVTWGPHRVGDVVMVITDGKQLRCFQADRTERWEQPGVAYGTPASPPLEVDGDFIFVSQSGTLWRMSGATGEEVDKTELSEPVGSGPISYNGSLLLCGNDGTLHVLPMLAKPAP